MPAFRRRGWQLCILIHKEKTNHLHYTLKMYSTIKIVTILVLLTVPASIMGHTEEKPLFLREDLETLANWRSIFFPKIQAHTLYGVVSDGM
jgi:hypothetical protein